MGLITLYAVENLSSDVDLISGLYRCFDYSYYEITFKPNSTAVFMGTEDVVFAAEKDGYSTGEEDRNVWWMTKDMGGMVDIDIWIEKQWTPTQVIIGTVKNETGHPLENVEVIAEGPYYFYNANYTDENGNFSILTIAGNFEFFFMADGYFINYTEVTIIEPITNLGSIYLELIPPYSSGLSRR